MSTIKTKCWMHRLNGAQLHRLAVLLGSNCSGTKSVRLDGIKDVLLPLATSSRATTMNFGTPEITRRRDGLGGSAAAGDGDNHDNHDDENVVRLVSVDMGIRNLAYAFLTVATTKCEFASCSSSGVGLLPTKASKSVPDGELKSKPKDIRHRPKYTAGPGASHDTGGPSRLETITLQAWRKIDISSTTTSAAPKAESTTGEEKSEGEHVKAEAATSISDAYHPSIYATHAYNFASSILQHNPTHIIIERQRFRSGGGASVQEWSLRVGMFEAMLWAVLKTKMKMTMVSQVTNGGNHGSDRGLQVESVLPARVNRYWLEEGLKQEAGNIILSSREADEDNNEDETDLLAGIVSKGSKLTGRDMKKAKIAIASALLMNSHSPDRREDGEPIFSHATTESNTNTNTKTGRWCLEVGPTAEVQEMKNYFLNEVQAQQQPGGGRLRRSTKKKKTANDVSSSTDGARSRSKIRSDSGSSEGMFNNLSETKITKLDDLADCFLQGLAWLRWRRNRLKVVQEGDKAFDLDGE